MYRICIARSGSYYAQRSDSWGGWKMIGPFCRTRRGAENVIAGARANHYCTPQSRVVGYY